VKNVRITVLVLMLVATSVAVIVGLAYNGAKLVGEVNAAWHQVTSTDEPMAMSINGIRSSVNKLRLQDQTILVDYDKPYLAKQLSDMRDAQQAIDAEFAAWDAIQNKDPQAQAAFEEFLAAYDTWAAGHSQFVSLATRALESNDPRAHNVARDLSRGSLRDARKVMESKLEATDVIVRAILEAQTENTSLIERQVTSAFGLLAILGTVFAVMMGALVLLSIRSSLDKGVAYAEAIAQGEFDTSIDHPGNEIGTLTRAIERMKVSLVENITERASAEERLAKSLSSVIDVVSHMVEARDPYTAGHQRRVAELATAIAEELGMPEQQVEEIRVAALIHDVGKMSIPVEILSRPGEQPAIEYELIKGHSEAGYKILSSAGMDATVTELVYQHHERCDGSGYPRGLADDDVMPGARVLAVADVVEAMTSHRPYRAALGIGPALAEIESGAGTRYCPDAAQACLRVFREGGFRFSES
jgi:putative nucleotidyltransferase with HDIG domain